MAGSLTFDEVSLEDSYALCRGVARQRGSTFYWATRLLPRVKQHHVQALYALCRYADDLVDEQGQVSTDDRAKGLEAFGDRLFDDLQAGRSTHPLLKAVVHTVKAFDIEPRCFERFLASMAMDLTVTQYETWDDLLVYIDGAAAVVGEMMLPILEPNDRAVAVPHARDLGTAFQLTKILRDVGEDLARSRVYLPQAELRRYGADPATERSRATSGEGVSEAWAALMRFEIGRCRNLYVSADLGVGMLPERSARAVRAARLLYSATLDAIEDHRYDVFSARIRVPAWHKLALAGQAMRRAP
jgi:phytoene synthase